MQISLSEVGKRFNREWIFRNLNWQFQTKNHYAITGPNGSGKSTLLQVIAGAVTHSKGSINYEVNGKEFDPENAFQIISLAAPYQELIEEMTLVEFLVFHGRFKPFLKGTDAGEVIGYTGLESSANKQIRFFSSGMKQRVKLAQCIFSDTPCVLLDEPCTNLDTAGIQLYHRLVGDFCEGRLVIVSSNDPQEYNFCEHVLNIMNYK